MVDISEIKYGRLYSIMLRMTTVHFPYDLTSCLILDGMTLIYINHHTRIARYENKMLSLLKLDSDSACEFLKAYIEEKFMCSLIEVRKI